MALYCVNTEVLGFVPKIGSASTVSSASLMQYCQDVTSEIDGKLSGLYNVPFSSTPPLIKAVALRMTAWDVLTMRVIDFPLDDAEQNPALVRLQESRDFLAQIARGEIKLFDSSGTLIPQTATLARSSTQGFVPTFSEGDLMDQIQDDSKLLADLGARGLL